MSDDRFPACLAITLRFEGGKVDDPADPGGRTNKGITQRVFDAWRTNQGQPTMDVYNISDTDVAAIYRQNYWGPSGAGNLAEPLDLCQFDAAVNHGVSRADAFLQVCNDSASQYLDAREAFYHQLVTQKPQLAKFLNGWLSRVNKLRAIVGTA